MSGKLKLAIIGIGGRGTACFGKILTKREDVEVVAFCDPNPVRMEAAGKFLHVTPHFYETIGAMAEKETLDGVIITSPDFCHRPNAVEALKHGWNVLIDKPLATTVEEGCEIIDTARNVGKIVMVGFNLRHHAVLKRLKEMIDSGLLGKVFLAENREFYDGGRTYMSRWNRLYSKTGGLWVHKGSHDFDVFNWLLGFPKPLRVTSFAAVNVLTPDGLPFELENEHEPGPGCDTCYYRKKCKDRYLLTEDEQGA